jgi:Glycosyl transferase family 2
MKSLRLRIVLIAVVVAVLGALLHPLSLILGFAPFDIRGLVAALVEVRATIANLLGWGLLSLLTVTVAYIALGRRHAVPGYRAQTALLVVVLAVLGAILHPIAFLLSNLPWNTSGLVSILNSARSTIADLLGWAVVALLVLMTIVVSRDRFLRRLGSPKSAPSEPESVRDTSDAGPMAVAITAYNDAEATADAVRQFKSQPGVIEVIVIDNNSRDNTAELASAAGARVIREPRQGFGYTCMRGLLEAARVPGADVIVLTEGDGTFVGRDIPKFQAYIGQAEMVVGSRVTRELVERGSQMDHFFTWGNIAVAFLLRLRGWDRQFLGTAGLTDVGCTFRAIRRDALLRILPDLSVGGNHFLPHMMLVALARGVSVIEIPVTFRRRVGQSKGASQSLRKGLAVGLAMIWHIMTYQPSLNGSRKPDIVLDRKGPTVDPDEVESRTGEEWPSPAQSGVLVSVRRTETSDD